MKTLKPNTGMFTWDIHQLDIDIPAYLNQVCNGQWWEFKEYQTLDYQMAKKVS